MNNAATVWRAPFFLPVFFYCKSRFSLGLALDFLNRAVPRCFCFLIGYSSCWVCRRGFTLCVRRINLTSSRSWTEGGRSVLVSWWPRSRVLKRVKAASHNIPVIFRWKDSIKRNLTHKWLPRKGHRVQHDDNNNSRLRKISNYSLPQWRL